MAMVYFRLNVFFLLFVAARGLEVTDENNGIPYGVDCSFPIHYKNLRCNGLLPEQESIYGTFMEGCYAKYGSKHCDDYENDRIEMNLKQPESMVNYTDTGFKKIKAPTELFQLLKTHFDRNHAKMKEEKWPKGNIYVNHWASPTYMISVEDTEMEGGSLDLKNKVWNAAKPVVEAWTGMELKPTSQYGIRVYTEGAILNPHADRLPLVSSAIVNVAQDVDEDWLLEVYDRDGNAVNVTMEPGDMVLYESGSLIHGRPFPLKGRYYANIFIHFEPTGRPLNFENYDYVEEMDEFFPPYLLPNGGWADEWRRRNPTGWHQASPSAAHVDTLPAFEAAAHNDVKTLQQIAMEDSRSLFAKDRNGWMPIHEAARGGCKEALEFLVDLGVPLNAKTHKNKGVTPLTIAINAHSEDHDAVRYLKEMGAEL
ncbi:ankyrin repeat domain protein [Nitzschia inconspicua]|uniref:Ankyrin repeat domain protein n=1 Tax=Nitzschia inconspicua TaxID=303405 RepID=A0A9K3KRI8_9STRA|nr:ankyrin repeat domain protein [Nitzschia inconspicua]